MKKIKKIKVIDSILQVTKDVVQQSNTYNEYIIKQNNSLFIKQLPLLNKHSRINSLVLLKPKLKEIEKDVQSVKNSFLKEEKKDSIFSPLNNIRSLKLRSKKLPPLCPLYNQKGILRSGLVSPKREFSRNNILNNDYKFLGCLPCSVEIERNKGNIFRNKKLKIKKICHNKSFEMKISNKK